MADEDLKESYTKKITRFKERLAAKDSELNILLEITNALNHNESTLDILAKFEAFVREQLGIEKLILFAKYKKWRCMLQYNVKDSEIDNFDVERDLLNIKDITSVNSLENKLFKNFDMVVPVYYGERPLAYLILGDISEEAVGMSSIIKHLNFLKLLTNIIVSAIENQRLAKEALKQEREKQKLIEKQNEMLEQQVAERTKELLAEKEESEHLLHNILPVEVANELKQKGYTTAKSYDQVTMLFTDFKGFTETSSKISPQYLLSELNDIFKAFDLIMGKYDVEKIKTIGDAYMAVCGLPIENSEHAYLCIKAATEMLNFLDQRAKTAKIQWKMRVGIHSGALVAGVVGTKKFTYDVWGDTVNTASRMESNGEPGKINISQTTFNLVKNKYRCQHRGKVVAKGKGEIDMYFVLDEIEPKVKSNGLPMAKLPVSKIKEFIVKKLKSELPADLFYHGAHHTLDVYEAAKNIAKKEGVSGEDLELLQIAALYHDTGFIKAYKGHEEAGCELARHELPGFGCNNIQIEKICGMIIATKMPQNAKTHLEEILCDSDLDYLGTDKFIAIGETLRKELNEKGNDFNEKQWNIIQIKFLEDHRYLTNTSKQLRGAEKLKHINMLKEIAAKG